MMKRILVVDDDELILTSLEDLFAGAGFEIHTASSGREALRRAAEQRFDLIVLDVVMPKMSGLEVCETLRLTEGYASLPIVMLTAKNTVADEQKGRSAGATLYLPKPFDPARLLSLVRELLEHPAT